MTRPTIAAHIPTYNCPDLLIKCVSHLLWVDEIIITDNSNNDSVKDILPLINHQNLKYYKTDETDLRLRLINFIPKTNSDYILWVCSDEFYDERTEKEILEVLSKTNNLKDAYIIPSESYLFGEYYGTGADQMRMFKKDKFFFEFKSIHEMPKVSGTVGKLNNGYKHHNSPTFSIYAPKPFLYAINDAKILSNEHLQLNRIDIYSSFQLKKHYFLFLLKILWRSRHFFLERKIRFIDLWLRYANIITIISNDTAPTEEIRTREGKG